MDTLEIPAVRFQKEGPLLIATYLKGADVDLSQAKTIVETRIRFQNHLPMYVLVKGEPKIRFNKAAREYLTSIEGTTGIIASAILVPTPVHVIIAYFFLKIKPPPMPAEAFYLEKDALKWLRAKGLK